ncbi:MAG: CPBP family intramembrane metalloprotease [Phycisphaera sp.]|nr:MAG: CPBP family intramembrane metalloprotease [Phycisphaera sp.]
MDEHDQTPGELHPPTEPPSPTPGPPPDAGSRGAARLAWLVLLVVLPLVVVMQQLQAYGGPEVDKSKIAAPQGEDVEISARLGTRVAYGYPPAASALQQQLDETVMTPLQEFRAAVAAGELVGPEEAADRLDGVINDLEGGAKKYYYPGDPDDEARKAQLLTDAQTLRDYYRDIAESGDAAEALDDDVLEGIIERHGYFGELARIAKLPEDHELREELLDGAMPPLVLMTAMMVLIGVCILAGLGLGITAIILIAGKRVRVAMDRPMRGGSVYLESAVLFVVGFALISATQTIAAQFGETAELVAGLLGTLAQWLLLLVPLWPLLRGVSWGQLRDDLGLRAPKGVMVEILAGVGGYLALLPLLMAGVGIMLVLLGVQELIFPSDPDAAGPSNPILEMARSLDPFILVLLFALATIWAPLCEELIFRGALFRHLRSRMAIPLAAILSALVFGMMHGYAGVQLIPVTVIGFNFALIRAWRGSLYGCIVAHALNNAVVLTLLFAFAHVLFG